MRLNQAFRPAVADWIAEQVTELQFDAETWEITSLTNEHNARRPKA
jgi:hypothetical protein